MNDLPAPLVSAEVDLHGFSGFMLDVDRLLASELVALGTPEECWAAVMLWCRAWKQSPPASLPDDDRVLAAFSGTGKRWSRVKTMALRGFIKCSDGRLYHRVLAKEANEGWKRRSAHIAKRDRDAGRLRQWRDKRRDGNDDETRFETDSETHFDAGEETPNETQSETDGETRFVSERDRDRDRDRDSKISSLRSDRAKQRGTRLSPDWQPSTENLAYAAAKGLPQARIGPEAERFRDYWIARPGQGGVKLDWDATWRTWVSKTCERSGYAPTNGANGHAELLPRPPTDEREAEKRLEVGRVNSRWPRPKWGPAPNEPGCLIPAHLVRPDDGVGWAEWQT